MEHVIETFSLTKIFPDWWGRAKVRAVQDLNLKIRQNEVFGLLGPNGSGKTTTIKMILGLLYPTKGKVLVFGGDSTDPKISKRIGFLPEESYLYRYLTARETLDFYGRLFSLPSQVRKTRTEALLDMVGLRSAANRHVGTFSKGMARRIGLAQALINDPDLLILDEPTTGLDPIGTRQIKDLILTLAKRGKTILLSSHLLADVEDVCDRIAILYGGKIQTEGQVGQLLQMADKTRITSSRLSMEAINKIRTIIENESIECEVDSPMDSLEHFFIKTVDAAQQSDLQTSGAVSTTNIGDFLSAKPVPEESDDVIESLVKEEEAVEEVVEQKTPVETPEVDIPKTDENLLNELTKLSIPAPQTVTPSPQPQEQPSKEETGVDENILDQLTKGMQQKSEEDDGPENDWQGG